MPSFLRSSSLKKLLPVGVVGTSVAITIKLLTVATTPTTELLNVNPEEDIKKVEDYVEELEEEREEMPPPVEKAEQEEGSEEEQLEDEDAEEMEAGSGAESQEETPPKEPESKEQENQSKANLTFRDGELKGIFSAIFNDET